MRYVTLGVPLMSLDITLLLSIWGYDHQDTCQLKTMWFNLTMGWPIQGMANCSVLATPPSLPLCVNAVLLEHSHVHLHVLSMAAFNLQWQSDDSLPSVSACATNVDQTYSEKKSRGCWHAHTVRTRMSASVLDKYRLLSSSLFPKQ